MLDKKMQTLASMLIHLGDIYYVTRSIDFPIGTRVAFINKTKATTLNM